MFCTQKNVMWQECDSPQWGFRWLFSMSVTVTCEFPEYKGAGTSPPPPPVPGSQGQSQAASRGIKVFSCYEHRGIIISLQIYKSETLSVYLFFWMFAVISLQTCGVNFDKIRHSDWLSCTRSTFYPEIQFPRGVTREEPRAGAQIKPWTKAFWLKKVGVATWCRYQK